MQKIKYLCFIIFITIGSGFSFIINASSEDSTKHDATLHCTHFPSDCKKSIKSTVESQYQQKIPSPTEPGQSIFGAIAEVNKLLEEGNVDWNSVDLDALMEHLKDMDNLMTNTMVRKNELPNGLTINVSNSGNGQRAMDNMIPAHASFLQNVRPNWTIKYEKEKSNYIITVTSEIQKEAIKIKGLGFAGFMVQDDHHASHHMSLALKKMVH
ncbi:hypothetical protein [Marinomonas transparens]|uniref:Uncharacterized protein n=1 Tax=Marinomonas transparens TaxID=2795388 RepID=A0A934JSH1_9GAMM|nr:hypothetical protein [Marinomonas transparens]MBJ7539908.1 hypothetical protein [Marinomonas transparens]